jgi:flagellar hook-associated protein 2
VVSGLNLNNLNVDSKTGQVSFSGLSSGIDFQSVVDAIIKSRQIPIDSLQTDVSGRDDKIKAYNDFNTLLTNLKNSMSKLYGAVSFQNASDDFQARSVYASTTRSDGQAPADAASLVSAASDNSAAIANHTLEVMRIATAQKIAATSVSSTTGTLGTLLGVTDGSFDLNGVTIDVFASDTIQDLRDRINAANKGASPTGVSASIVSVSATQNILVLSSDKTGAANQMAFTNETGGVLASLGISNDGGTTIVNQLQAGLDARMKADGLKDLHRWESNNLVSQTATLSNYITTASANGSFDVTIGATTHTINYTGATDTLQTLRDAINTAFGSSVASIDSDPSGYRLVINGGASTTTVTDTNGLLTDLGLDNDQVITRSSNNVTDLFAGITLSLFNAQEGTTVHLDVSQDLSKPQTDIKAFVTAYNAVRQFVNTQNARDATTGVKASNAGPLFASSTLANIQSQLSSILGTGVQGANPAFSALGQIGVGFVDNSTLSDPTLADTLQIDDTKLNNALINNPDDVRRLFSFEFSSSSPKVTLLGFDGNTQYSQAGHVLNVQYEKSFDSTHFTLTPNTGNSPMSDYLALVDGSFEVHDSSGLVGTVNYTAGESLSALAADIDALAGVNSRVVTDGTSFHIEIKSDTNDALTFQADTGGLVAALGITNKGDAVFSANIDGAADGSDDGSATVSGVTITATDKTGANGLKLFYNGNSDLSGASLNYTVGIGAQINFAVDSMQSTDGVLQTELKNLNGQNDLANQRITEMQDRLDIERQALLAKYQRMETNLATAQNIMDQIQQTMNASFGSNSKNGG